MIGQLRVIHHAVSYIQSLRSLRIDVLCIIRRHLSRKVRLSLRYSACFMRSSVGVVVHWHTSVLGLQNRVTSRQFIRVNHAHKHLLVLNCVNIVIMAVIDDRRVEGDGSNGSAVLTLIFEHRRGQSSLRLSVDQVVRGRHIPGFCRLLQTNTSLLFVLHMRCFRPLVHWEMEGQCRFIVAHGTDHVVAMTNCVAVCSI